MLNTVDIDAAIAVLTELKAMAKQGGEAPVFIEADALMQVTKITLERDTNGDDFVLLTWTTPGTEALED